MEKFKFINAAVFFTQQELDAMQLRDFAAHREMFMRLAAWAGRESEAVVLQGMAVIGKNDTINVDSSIPLFRFGAANNAARFKLIFEGVVREFTHVITNGGNSADPESAAPATAMPESDVAGHG